MTRCLIVLIAALAAVPAALADGPMPYASQEGGGVLSADGASRYVALGSYMGSTTTLAQVATTDGSVLRSVPLAGSWGVPVPTYGSSTGEGVSHDGRTLVLEDVVAAYPHATSSFLFLRLPSLRVGHTAILEGDFAFDALSPDGTRLYLIQHVDAQDQTRYVVRAYDTTAMRLLPGRIADRTQKSWIMRGYPMSRTQTPDGRWVYTLYDNPGGFPFVHALDTVRGVAHCIGLPLRTNAAYNLRLSLHGTSLHVHWASGRRWLVMDTRSWRLSPDRAAFPWWAVGAGGGILAALLAGAALAHRRRRTVTVEAELAELLRDRETEPVA